MGSKILLLHIHSNVEDAGMYAEFSESILSSALMLLEDNESRVRLASGNIYFRHSISFCIYSTITKICQLPYCACQI